MNNTTRVVTAIALLGASLAVVTMTRWGPVVLVISESRGHGVHAGDLVTIPMGLAALALLGSVRKRRKRA
jgi:MYXO-CTERM domain-containing protein